MLFPCSINYIVMQGQWIFSQTLLLLEGEKPNCHLYYVEIACNTFEKRAANSIRMRKIAITTLKLAFGF